MTALFASMQMRVACTENIKRWNGGRGGQLAVVVSGNAVACRHPSLSRLQRRQQKRDGYA